MKYPIAWHEDMHHGIFGVLIFHLLRRLYISVHNIMCTFIYPASRQPKYLSKSKRIILNSLVVPPPYRATSMCNFPDPYESRLPPASKLCNFLRMGEYVRTCNQSSR